MKLDKLIEQRFSELEEKASAVGKTLTRGTYSTNVNSGKFNEWATNVLALIQRVFGEESPHYKNFNSSYDPKDSSYHLFDNCVGVFRAAKEDYLGGYLFTVRGLIKAEDSMDVTEQASELLKSGYKDPSCVLAGVGLEIALKELCTQNTIAYGKLDAMNVELCKKEVYNMAMQKQITAWAHLRNCAAHGEWDQYSNSDVEDMIRGVTRFVAEYL